MYSYGLYGHGQQHSIEHSIEQEARTARLAKLKDLSEADVPDDLTLADAIMHSLSARVSVYTHVYTHVYTLHQALDASPTAVVAPIYNCLSPPIDIYK